VLFRVGTGRVFSIRSGRIQYLSGPAGFNICLVRPDSIFVWSGRIQYLSGPVRLKSGRFIFDVKLTKIRQKSGKDPSKNRQKFGFVQPDELAKIRFRPAE
jgi:hypothetical protein